MITAAEKAWLGFTPMDESAVASMIQMWRSHDLPGRPDFSRWSAEFAREVWELVAALLKQDVIEEWPEAKDGLIKLLGTMGCWSDDPAEFQWVPKGWSADG